MNAHAGLLFGSGEASHILSISDFAGNQPIDGPRHD